MFVAVAAAVGYFLQGWDNATIAGALLYIKKDFNLEPHPNLEGLIVAMSLIGAAAVTTCCGAISDCIGRRPMLITSSILYFIGGLVMLWSPNVYVLLLARLLDGFGLGLSVTLVPLYISETAPTEIRGLLNTLPQFAGSLGMFLSYCMVFGMSLMIFPSWRLMLGLLSLLSLFYFGLTVFFLPESPRWLVSKGRMLEARWVLQRLRGKEDVSGELALLVEGLGVGGETSIEEYIIGPANDLTDDVDPAAETERIKLFGPEEALSFIARPVVDQSALGLVSRHGSLPNPRIPLIDPVVSLFDGIHERLPETGSRRSALFATLGSMFSIAGPQPKTEEWDEESFIQGAEDYASEDIAHGDSDDDLQSPLMLHQASLEKDIVPPQSHGSILSMRHSGFIPGNDGEAVSSMNIGGGWQLAWKFSERGNDAGKDGGFKRIYFHQEASVTGVDVPAVGEFIQVAALVNQSALCSKELMSQHAIGPAMIHPSEAATRGSTWSDLFEPGVKHALVVGAGIQVLQQLSGINGVLYYTPQILEQAGVGALLYNMGISSASASLLISAVIALLMLPCIAVAMRLMDITGRRMLLLATIPVLIASLIIQVVGNVVNMGTAVHAIISIVSVVIYFCCFAMGFGPIPNILCSEIFPTRIRGLCIAICALTFWIGDIIVSYTLPVMLTSVGVAGIFSMYAMVCLISWVFIFWKVPETKCFPLEVITEFFSVGARNKK